MHHTSPLEMLPLIAVILIGAKIAGKLSQRFGMPSVFGELLLGLALGPSLLNLVHPSDTLALLAEIGVILLMFRAGLETDLVQMRQVGAASFVVAMGGVLLPLGGGYLIATAFGMQPLHALFVGAVLTATSVSISAEVLRELGRLRGRVGSTILGAAIIDDVLGVIVLSVVLGLAGEGDPLWAIGRMIVFFPVAWFIGDKLLPWLVNHKLFNGEKENILALLLGLLLLFAWSAESLGSVAAITGAYLFGIVAARHTDEEHVIHHGSSALAYSFLVPMFFVNIGVAADAHVLGAAPLFTVAILAFALVSKVIGCGAGALLTKFDMPESIQVGVGMIARGEVALVMIAAGKAAGLVDDTLFSAAIVMTLVTTLVTPPLLRAAFNLKPIELDLRPGSEPAAAAE